MRKISTHSLTKRLTEVFLNELLTSWHFNSQPHEEADTSNKTVVGALNISTHSLTKRLTLWRCLLFCTTHISTHSLTKRLTKSWKELIELEIISTHSLTKRLTMNSFGVIAMFMWFQLTASRRGWQSPACHKVCNFNISTHSLTKRLTRNCEWRGQLISFQLTASRRGWHKEGKKW